MRTRLVAALVIPLVIAGATAVSAAGPHWSIVAGPKVAAGGGLLDAVVMTKHHGFAVGSQNQPGGSQQPLIERFSAGSWRRINSPVIAGGGALNGVDGTDTNGFAVGYSGQHGLAERWNGRIWKRVAVPSGRNGALLGVSVRAADNAWAVGIAATTTAEVPWAIHWNGSRWSTVSIPNPGHRRNGLPATAALVSVTTAGKHVYAVGTADGRGRGSGRAVAEMYSGGRWHVMKLPSLPGGVSALSSVAGTSSHNVWAVGSDYNDTPHTVALHWNGHRWTRAHTPDPGQGELGSVSASSARSIWAVGQYTASDGWTKPLAEHWNGHRWRRVPAPAAPIGSFRGCSGLGDGYQGLSAVSVVPGSSQAWAVGYHDRLTCNSVRLPLLERYR